MSSDSKRLGFLAERLSGRTGSTLFIGFLTMWFVAAGLAMQATEAVVPQAAGQSLEAQADGGAKAAPRQNWNRKRTTHAERKAAAARAQAAREALAAAASSAKAAGTRQAAAEDGRNFAFSVPGGTPDVFGIYSNWANSPRLTKFVDGLPGLGPTKANNLGQYLPIANPDTVTYPGSDYYEISAVEYEEKMHTQLLPTRLRGFVQTNRGTNTAACGGTGQPACTPAHNTLLPATVHYLGPVIVATKDRPVRIKVTNELPTGAAGKLFIPVDTTVMGAGPGPNAWNGLQPADQVCRSAPDAPTPPGCFTENRVSVHLHGGRTPWISDGTPHQWFTPAGEITTLNKGLSFFNVPDMPDPGPGSQTFYYTNQQSARLMFYHDHAQGITRLNVYAGMAAGYLITDDTEKQLVAGGVIPSEQIPLVIQDKTYVDPAAVRRTDPTWNWGTGALAGGIRTPKNGDLWWPHVYVPAQNPYDISGVNPWGRWAYGPWFWPPTANIQYGPVRNALYDPNCDPDVVGYCQPPARPGNPDVSWGAEAFLDTPVVNGTAYPTLTVQPKPYRFRILNAAHDRFWNLQLYRADATGTEVRMVPAAQTSGFPETWPTDGREGGVPDPAQAGPPFIQIGNEGGFLPRPAVIAAQPVAWNLDPTTFNFGNVSDHGLLLGPAERADVIVDFAQYAGQTLILYNDAPAAFPAYDPRVDYYTGAPDNRDTGGVSTPLAGYGPNTRTIMQIKVAAGAAIPLNMAALNAAFTPTDTTQGVFQKGQEPIIVGQKTYNAPATQPTASIYKTAAGVPVKFPNTWPNWGVARIQDTSLNFKTTETAAILNSAPLSLQMGPKAIHDEMGAAYDEYGRMSARLGTEMPFTTNLIQNFVIQAYWDPATENVNASPQGAPTPGDTTQIWKITHNGVDTHPVHFHLFDVQLVNRVGWDGSIRLPDDNELGWKDTIRISPLEDTIVAVRPVAPRQPFGIPDSWRPLNPALPLGSPVGFTNINTTTGAPITPPVLNLNTNFGWEYVWHCHILSHEEADMMRPVVMDQFTVTPLPPAVNGLSRSGVGLPVALAWTDPTPVGPDPSQPLNLGNLSNEIGFNVYRATVTNGTPGPYTKVGTALANASSYTDATSSASLSYSYKVAAFNVRGEGPASNTISVTASTAAVVAPSGLIATLLSATQVRLNWTDNSNNETGFTIQRASDNAFTTGLTSFSAGANAVTYTDTGVVTGTYYYRVIALNGAVESLPSNTASVTVNTTLNAPSNLTAALANNPLRVTLRWVDNSGTAETGFTIQRASDSGFTANLVTYTVAANIATLVDTNLTIGQTYYYHVRADAAPGAPSGWSNTVSVGPPAAPSGLVASQAAGTGTNVVLAWMDNADNETTFTVERALVPGGFVGFSTRPAHAGVGLMTVTDTTFTRGGTYRYQVRANNFLGSSAWVISADLVTH